MISLKTWSLLAKAGLSGGYVTGAISNTTENQNAEWCLRAWAPGRCRGGARSTAGSVGSNESPQRAGDVAGPCHLSVGGGILLRLWDSAQVGVPLQLPFQWWKSECIFLLQNFYPSHKCIHLHTLSSFPAQKYFHIFSLLCLNCFYTVSNTPQVPSIHNCCYLVKCFP